MTFGEALRDLRRKRGVSQRELAIKTGLDFTYISKLENDRNPPPAADTVVNICRVLDEAPEKLLALIGKIPSNIQESISGSQAAQEFLRDAQQQALTDDEWRLLSDRVKQLKSI